MTAGAASGRRGWLRRGVWTGPVGAEGVRDSDMGRWITETSLTVMQKAVLQAIRLRANWTTWSWPPRIYESGGSSEADLASIVGRCVRQIRRVLRQLEELGCLITWDRRPLVNAYQLVPARIRALAEGARGHRRAEKARRLEERARAAMGAAAAGLRGLGARAAAVVRPRAGTPSSDAKAAPSSVPVPAWARRAAGRHGHTSAEVEVVVRQCVAAVLGDVGDAQLGPYARPVLRLWKAAGHPPPEELAGDLALVAAAAQNHCDSRWSGIRGLDRRGRRTGPDNTRSVRALCRVGPWADRLRLAKRWAEEQASAEGDGTREGTPTRVHPALEPPPPELVRQWAGWLQELRRAGEAQDVAIWLEPLHPRAVEDGQLHLVAPNVHVQRWAVEHWAARLGAVSGLRVVVEVLGAL